MCTMIHFTGPRSLRLEVSKHEIWLPSIDGTRLRRSAVERMKLTLLVNERAVSLLEVVEHAAAKSWVTTPPRLALDVYIRP